MNLKNTVFTPYYLCTTKNCNLYTIWRNRRGKRNNWLKSKKKLHSNNNNNNMLVIKMRMGKLVFQAAIIISKTRAK